MLIKKDTTLSINDMKELLDLIVRNCAVNFDISTTNFALINSSILKIHTILNESKGEM